MAFLSQTNWYWFPHYCGTGVEQMALDEALLTWLQHSMPNNISKLLVRTYQWNTPTLSFGVHQQDRDCQRAYQHYAAQQAIDIVRRPTGGRAILHGKDISFAFVTNAPEVLKMSLEDSYCVFMTWIRLALEQCGVPLQQACVENNREYTRSPLCFETKTTSDLMTPDHQKVAGSAQLRRREGILQHGAAFLSPFQISVEAFETALQEKITAALNTPFQPLTIEAEPKLQALWVEKQAQYAQEIKIISDKLSTTAGSHFVPASD